MSIIGNLRVTWSIGLSAKRFIGTEPFYISENLTDLTQSLALELWSLRWQNWNRLFRIRNRIKPHQSIISLQRYNRDTTPERGGFFFTRTFPRRRPNWKSTSIFHAWKPVDSVGYPVWHQMSQKMNLSKTVSVITYSLRIKIWNT